MMMMRMMKRRRRRRWQVIWFMRYHTSLLTEDKHKRDPEQKMQCVIWLTDRHSCKTVTVTTSRGILRILTLHSRYVTLA